MDERINLQNENREYIPTYQQRRIPLTRKQQGDVNMLRIIMDIGF